MQGVAPPNADNQCAAGRQLTGVAKKRGVFMTCPKCVPLLDKLLTITLLVDPPDKSIQPINFGYHIHLVAHHLGHLGENIRRVGPQGVSL